MATRILILRDDLPRRASILEEFRWRKTLYGARIAYWMVVALYTTNKKDRVIACAYVKILFKGDWFFLSRPVVRPEEPRGLWVHVRTE